MNKMNKTNKTNKTNKIYISELYHHGIEGMKWGVKNGPPYPLDPEDYSPIHLGFVDRKASLGKI